MRRRLGFADGTPADDLDDDTAAAIAALESAGALILATPIYRGSMTGSLKNLFDLMPVPALQGKVVGLVAMGASDHHYLGAERHLRDVLAFFGAVVMPVAVYLNGGDFEDGVPGERAATALDELFAGTAEPTALAALDGRAERRCRRAIKPRPRGAADADRRDADRRTPDRRDQLMPMRPPTRVAGRRADALPDSSVRAIVIDAHAPSRVGLAALLDEQPWIERCLLASGSEESVGLTRRHRPDVAILDISQTAPSRARSRRRSATPTRASRSSSPRAAAPRRGRRPPASARSASCPPASRPRT